MPQTVAAVLAAALVIGKTVLISAAVNAAVYGLSSCNIPARTSLSLPSPRKDRS